jgi:hypothetical protein
MIRWLAISLALALPAFADERPVEIDQNTKTQGGADLRGSGANAGAGARSDNKTESEPRIEERRDVAQPDKVEHKEDRPISERKPSEAFPQPETSGKGATAPQPAR